MSKRCELTGISPQKGHNVSHAKNKTKRRFLPNLKKVTFRSDILKKNIKLNVANAALRTVDYKGGLDKFLLSTKNVKLSKKVKKLNHLYQQNHKMNLYYRLSILMGFVVVASNYLVQFPIQQFGLGEILTYGAFSYPITFLITDLANRAYGKTVARKVVYIGFIIGVLLTLLISTNFSDIISIRIAVGSGTAFFIAQNLDVQIFDRLRKRKWFIAPLTSSIIGSITDTFLFFSIAFYASGIPWLTLALGDLSVKFFITILMLVPFRLLLYRIKDYTDKSVSRI